MKCFAVIAALLAAAVATPARSQMLRLDALPRALAGEPFGLASTPAPAGPLWIRWRGFDDARAAEGERRLAIVNRAVNLAVAYAGDERRFGRSDVWSGALETFESGAGDCEDYAIAKFFVLRAAGVPDGDLRLVLAHNRSDGNVHAVLAVRDGGRWLILNNRRMAPLAEADEDDLDPLFALDAGGVRQFVTPAMTLAALP